MTFYLTPPTIATKQANEQFNPSKTYINILRKDVETNYCVFGSQSATNPRNEIFENPSPEVKEPVSKTKLMP